MIRKNICRIKVSEFAGITEFGIDAVSYHILILGYNIKSEYAIRRKTFPIIYLTQEGLNIDIGEYNARNLLIDIKLSNYAQQLIIDGVDEIG